MMTEEVFGGNQVCRVCGSSATTDFPNFLDLYLKRCTVCGLVFNWSCTENSEEFLGEHSNYYFKHAAVRRVMFREELHRLSNWCSGRTLLDFGGGAGHLAAVAIELGWSAYVVEPNPVGRHVAATHNGLVHVYKDLDALPENVLFDIVVLNHVIEHVMDPILEMRRIRERMKPKGILLTTQPNLNFYGTSIYYLLSKMHLLDVRILSEGHVLVWGQRSLTIALEKAGFAQVKEVRPLSGRWLYRRLPVFAARLFNYFAWTLGVRPSFALIARA